MLFRLFGLAAGFTVAAAVDCTAGYTAGTVATPSTTCPTGCTLTDATALVAEVTVNAGSAETCADTVEGEPVGTGALACTSYVNEGDTCPTGCTLSGVIAAATAAAEVPEACAAPAAGAVTPAVFTETCTGTNTDGACDDAVVTETCTGTNTDGACDDGTSTTDAACTTASGTWTPVTCGTAGVTASTCETATGCVHTPVSAASTDATACAANSGTWTEVTCGTAGVTASTCETATGCVHTPVSAASCTPPTCALTPGTDCSTGTTCTYTAFEAEIVANAGTCVDVVDGEVTADCVGVAAVVEGCTSTLVASPNTVTATDATNCVLTPVDSAATPAVVGSCAAEGTNNAAFAVATCAYVAPEASTLYVAGDATTPSTTCPTGCTQVDAVAAVEAAAEVAAVAETCTETASTDPIKSSGAEAAAAAFALAAAAVAMM